MNLTEFQQEVASWSKMNFPNGKKYQPLLGVGEEVGELMHAHLKHEQKIRGMEDNKVASAAKMDAIGDIVIYLADYCARNGLSLNTCVFKTWQDVKLRNWLVDKLEGREKGD